MNNDLEAQHSRTPVARKVGAGAVLVIAVVVAVKLALGFLTAIFWTVIAVAVVVAIIWALKELFW